jgi:hypothetical protein
MQNMRIASAMRCGADDMATRGSCNEKRLCTNGLRSVFARFTLPSKGLEKAAEKNL